MVRILFFMAFCLAAAPVLSQGTLTTTHTGLSGAYSGEVQVSRHRHFAIYAQATVIRRGADTVYTVFLRHGLNDGSILYIDEAWSFGRQLRFDDLPPDRVCGGVRCLYTIGVLSFSVEEFSRMATTGIELQLIGSEGPITLSIPAHMFSEAATLAATVIH